MKLALIGNSHLACVKLAWTDGRHAARFLGGTAGHGGLPRAWRPADGGGLTLVDDAHPTQRLLWGMCCGEASSFPLGDLDAVVFVGILGAARPANLSNCPLAADVGWLGGRGVAPVSFPLWAASRGVEYGVEVQRWLVDLLRRGGLGDVPMLSVVRPHPRADAARFDPSYALPESWSRLPAADKAALAANERALIERLGRTCGVQVLHPPSALVVDGHGCPVRYSDGALGSRNFAGGAPQYGRTPADNPFNLDHKNAAYGAVVIEQIHRRLAGRPTDFDPAVDRAPPEEPAADAAIR